MCSEFIGFRRVSMPPGWRGDDGTMVVFALFGRELTEEELRHFFRAASEAGIRNARPVSPELMQMAAVLHPVFHQRMSASLASLPGAAAAGPWEARLSLRRPSAVPLERLYLQSMLFLAGCTLSAAIVQQRYSPGTLESKLSRLWQGARYFRRFGYGGVDGEELQRRVLTIAGTLQADPLGSLVALKHAYAETLGALTEGVEVQLRPVRAEPLSAGDRARFGFLPLLRRQLGSNLACVIAYGSSVTSEHFADYDVVLLVRDEERALRSLAGASPSYGGKEVNLGVYGPEAFRAFQSLSGDNLDRNARCLYGEAEIPLKPAADLMLRNFSFGFIRLRQLLGMAGFLAQEGPHFGLQDRSNLYDYFVKIPMHIMKGVLAVAGEAVAKEQINAWTAAHLGYDAADQARMLADGQPGEAVLRAYGATRGVMAHLNGRFGVYAPAGEVAHA